MTQRQDSPRCAKCDGEMHEGFIADFGHGEAVHDQQWVQGPPEKTFMFGAKIYDKERYRIVTFRCTECGYLESYAWDVA